MKKAVAGTEVLLTVGILIAVGVTLVELKGVFYGQEVLTQEEVVVEFSRDLDNTVDRAMSTTGDVAFVYYPRIKNYRVEINKNIVYVYDKVSKKTAGFSKSAPEIVKNIFEDSDKIWIIKKQNKIYILGKCSVNGSACFNSLGCCSGFCWGEKNKFVCQKNCAENDFPASDSDSCCSKFLNETLGLCTNPPVCPERSACNGATDEGVWKDVNNTACCPGNNPVCSSKHCCPENKPRWCNKPKTGSPRCVDDDEFRNEKCEEICPSGISQCINHWHWDHYDGTFHMNKDFYSCDMFEVCQEPVVKPIAEEIINCCKNKCAGSCHSMCNRAVSDSGLSSTETDDTRKKCYGLYAIYGLDGAAKWIQGYMDECLSSFTESCFEKPASIMFTDSDRREICTGYSVALTTLLRSVGYEKNEVYSTCGPGHAYNLVKFPGEAKYRFVDTVDNSLYISGISSSDWYRNYYGACRTDHTSGPDIPCGSGTNYCMNDEGNFICPSSSDIYLGASC